MLKAPPDPFTPNPSHINLSWNPTYSTSFLEKSQWDFCLKPTPSCYRPLWACTPCFPSFWVCGRLLTPWDCQWRSLFWSPWKVIHSLGRSHWLGRWLNRESFGNLDSINLLRPEVPDSARGIFTVILGLRSHSCKAGMTRASGPGSVRPPPPGWWPRRFSGPIF